jgi:hypothetical protein
MLCLDALATLCRSSLISLLNAGVCVCFHVLVHFVIVVVLCSWKSGNGIVHCALLGYSVLCCVLCVKHEGRSVSIVCHRVKITIATGLVLLRLNRCEYEEALVLQSK